MSDRFIGGTVNADGSIKNEGQFSVSRTGVGHYLVSFRPAFKHIEGGAATQIYDGSTLDNAVIIRLTPTEAFIKTGSSNGNPDDRPFTFIFAGVGSGPAK